MVRCASMSVLLLWPLFAWAEVGPEPRVVKDVAHAVRDGLAFLTNDSRDWRTARACASCHHLPMTLWAMHDVKKRGHPIDQPTANEWTEWVFAKNDPAKIFPKQPEPAASPKSGPALPEGTFVNQGALLLALGLQAGDPLGAATQPGVKNLLDAVIRGQGKDGSWRVMFEWQPIAAPPDVITTLALLALTAPNTPDMGDAGKVAKEKGLHWLTSTPPSASVQALALRIVLWQRIGRPLTESTAYAKQLTDQQNSDGGWSPASGLPSDAYATGQALYALAELGRPADKQALQRGQLFLLVRQQNDGSWAMVSRPGQPHGKSAKNTEPISHTGSAWAVMGLARTAPR